MNGWMKRGKLHVSLNIVVYTVHIHVPSIKNTEPKGSIIFLSKWDVTTDSPYVVPVLHVFMSHESISNYLNIHQEKK